MFLLSWLAMHMKSMSTCSGDFEMRRRICVSVSIFLGMRLSSTTLSGRMCCLEATFSSSAKMRSSSRISLAGSPVGMLIGMGAPWEKAHGSCRVVLNGSNFQEIKIPSPAAKCGEERYAGAICFDCQPSARLIAARTSYGL